MVRDERDAFVALARSLTSSQWQTPSLCAGWSVRDMVIHSGHDDGLRDLVTLARCRFSVHRMNQVVIEAKRSLPNETIIELLANLQFPNLSTRVLGVGNCLRGMVIHQQDIRRPLGLPRSIPDDHLRAVLDFVTVPRGSVNLGSAARAQGLHLVATDLDWAAGAGSEVRGPAEAILMAVAGRPDALPDLEGDGLTILKKQSAPR